ncbi:MAG: hypothetical protein ACAI38_19320, partial [Myxococcota bacterium]
MGRIQVVAVLCLAACGRSGYERELPAEVGDEDENAGDGDGGEGEQAPELIVEPIVAGAATSWNSYMRYPGETLDFVYEPCVSPSLYRDCVHAGELRRVAVPGAASCSELGITASPAAFEWRCSDTPNGAVFTTKRLAPGIGLRDLIDFAARSFRPISVTVTQTGQAPRVSAETVWWDNTVRVVPAAGEDGRIVIDDPGVVYLVPQTLAAHGIDLRADGVALVGAPQARLTPASTPPVRTCQSLSVGTHVPSARACLLHADAVDRVWIEIDTDAAAFAGMALVLDNTELARVHRSRFAPVADHGMQLRGAIACRLTDVTIERGNNNVVFASSGNLFANLRVAGGDVYLFSSDENVFDALTTFGAFAGINLNGSSGRNAFVNSLSFSHGGHGVQLAGSNNFANVFVGTTLAATTLAGAGMWSSDRTTFHLSAIVNAGEHGIDLTSRAATVSHLLTGANNFAGVEIQNLA